MTRINRKIIILIVVVILVTAFVFSNSLKNSQESHKDSGAIVRWVEGIVDIIFPNNTFDLNYIVRKGAHLFEFFVLGVVVMLLLLQVKNEKINKVVLACLYVIGIALTDEFIQSFNDRTSSFVDVLIDTSGGLIGIGLILLLCFIKRSKTKTRQA